MDSQTPPPAEHADEPLAEAAQVLADLDQAETHLRGLVARAQHQEQALRQAQEEATRLRSEVQALTTAGAETDQRLRASQTETARARVEEQRARQEAADARQEAADARQEMQRLREAAAHAVQEARAETQALRDGRAADLERARRLEALLADLHRALLSRDVYSLLLKACLSITGATRGVYVTRSGPDGPLRVRAAVDVDGYPQSPPSDFLRSLCGRVLSDGETLVAHSEADLAGMPAPSAPTERFHNAVAAPVALLKDMDGVVVAADKPGDFDDGDAQSIVAIGSQAGIAAENGQLRRRLQEAYLSTVSVMADAMEAKDAYTQGHSDMVSRLARLAARHLNLSDLDRSVVCFAALLHDIGKIGVSDGLINKPGPLLPEERELMRTHVRVGHDIIRHVPALGPVADAVLHHHEFYDGTGYPDGLAGDAIPMASRIVCVVDAYSAMISRRSYKEAYSEERARGELRRCAGTQFDPRVVEAFLSVLDLPDLGGLGAEDDEQEYEWLPAHYVAHGGTLSQGATVSTSPGTSPGQISPSA